MTTTHHLAYFSLARWVAPPRPSDMALLREVAATAERAPGFIWQMDDPAANAPYQDASVVVEISVWADMETLGAFVFHPGLRPVTTRQADVFDQDDVGSVLWWIQIGHQPTVAEAQARLTYLRTYGPSAAAFTFRRPFAAPGQTGVVSALPQALD